MHNRACEAHYNAQGGGKPSTVYDAIGAAQVAKASFSGMRLLHRVHPHVPIWPFDPPPESGSLIVEIYTSIAARAAGRRSEEHTSELQSLMRISYAGFCLKKKIKRNITQHKHLQNFKHKYHN